MKILLLYPKAEPLIASHVRLLAEGLGHSAEVQAAGEPGDMKRLVREMQPDIVHCHGCWHYTIARMAAKARSNGARIVITPHGQLEPWILKEKSLSEKLHKTILWQRRTVERAYCLIAFGKMEEKYLRTLKWNSRIEVVRNALTTNSITAQQMCSMTFAVYQKVIDSSVLQQMNDATRSLLATIIKAGITGDSRWTGPADATTPPDYRRLLIYAQQEGIRNYVDFGITTLGLMPPDIDTTRIASYLPTSYQPPQPIKDIVGEYKGDETDYLVRIIRQLQRQPLLLHLIELHRELLRDTVDDDLLRQALEEKGLLKFAQRLMQILSEQTLLTEGFMPVDPLDDRGTRLLRDNVLNHLTI